MSDALSVTRASLPASSPKTTTVEVALDAAEQQMHIKAQKRAAYRMALDRARKAYFEQLEAERMKNRIEHYSRLIGSGRENEIPEETLLSVIELHANGEPLKSSCEAHGFSRATMYRRVEKSEVLRDALSRAREECAHSKVDDTWTIARTEPDVERARLLTEIARWEVAKVLPTLYGDKFKVESPDGVVFSLNIGQLVEKKEETPK